MNPGSPEAGVLRSGAWTGCTASPGATLTTHTQAQEAGSQSYNHRALPMLRDVYPHSGEAFADLMVPQLFDNIDVPERSIDGVAT